MGPRRGPRNFVTFSLPYPSPITLSNSLSHTKCYLLNFSTFVIYIVIVDNSERLLPSTLNSSGKEYPNWNRAALFVLILVSIARSLAHILLPDGGAQSIASIPIDGWSNDASESMIGIFALWGESQLIQAVLLGVLVVRYRAFIPLAWLCFFVEWTGRLLISFMRTVVTEETAPGSVGNFVFPVLTLAGLLSALYSDQGGQGGRGKVAEQDSASGEV